MSTRRLFAVAVVAVSAFSAPICAQAVDATFTGGSLLISSSVFDDVIQIEEFIPGTVSALSAAATHSANNEGVLATLALNATIASTATATTVTIDATSQSLIPGNTAGHANIIVRTETAGMQPDPLILTLATPADFAITNAARADRLSVTLTPQTGSIVGNRLTAGTYQISLEFGSLASIPAPIVTRIRSDAYMTWVLTLTGESQTCPADFNGSGATEVTDIFAFLSAWFAQGPGSDFNASGATEVTDIFAFLSAWFAGCP